MSDGIGTVEGNTSNTSGMEEKVRLRTLAYTTTVGLLVFWTVAINIALLKDAASGDSGASDNFLTWADVNQVSRSLVTCLVTPLTITVPPIFRHHTLRLAVCLALNILGLLLLCLHLLSGLVWAAMVPTNLLLNKLVVLVLQQILGLLLAACLVVLAFNQLSSWQLKRGLAITWAVPQTGLHASHLLLVLVSAFLPALANLRHQGGASSEFSFFLPLCFFTQLLVVQLLHYTYNHVGLVTRQRAADRTRQFIDDFALTALEKELVHKKSHTERIIQGVFTAQIFSRKLC